MVRLWKGRVYNNAERKGVRMRTIKQLFMLEKKSITVKFLLNILKRYFMMSGQREVINA